MRPFSYFSILINHITTDHIKKIQSPPKNSKFNLKYKYFHQKIIINNFSTCFTLKIQTLNQIKKKSTKKINSLTIKINFSTKTNKLSIK